VEIKKVHIENYKSIKSANIDFGKLNILIGGNGVGKSNLISFFKFLNQIINNNLESEVRKKGGADNILYFGRKESKSIKADIFFKQEKDIENSYQCELEADQNNLLFFKKEHITYDTPGSISSRTLQEVAKEKIALNGNETGIHKHRTGIAMYVTNAFRDFEVYHFHDTSDTAEIKSFTNINDNRKLRFNASNLAAFLYFLKEKHKSEFLIIEDTIKQIAPFFDKFILEPNQLNESTIMLEWKETGSDKYFNAHSLSDGTLRMICLSTLLLQPKPPSTIIIDEPELGLHPAAITLLAELVKIASHKTQIILSTQSVTLLNQFSPENIIVVERENKQSVFKRLDEAALYEWREDYALGDIWEKNIFGGRP